MGTFSSIFPSDSSSHQAETKPTITSPTNRRWEWWNLHCVNSYSKVMPLSAQGTGKAVLLFPFDRWRSYGSPRFCISLSGTQQKTRTQSSSRMADLTSGLDIWSEKRKEGKRRKVKMSANQPQGQEMERKATATQKATLVLRCLQQHLRPRVETSQGSLNHGKSSRKAINVTPKCLLI